MTEDPERLKLDALEIMRELRRRAQRAARGSQAVFLFTFFNVLFALVQVSGLGFVLRIGPLDTALAILAMQIILLLVVALALLRYDNAAKENLIFAQEYADAVHWKGEGQSEELQSISAEFRIAFRKLSESESLPLVPKGSGMAIYMGLNLALVILSSYFVRLALA